MEQHDDTFRFTYSAQQRGEIESIRAQYLPREESKLERLRRLDRSVYRKAQIWAISLGVIGVLIMGAGMSLVMTELGAGLQWRGYELAMPLGIAAGLAGMLLVALAYPTYNATVKKERRRLAPEILRLTDELLQ